jgi:hypothetical protein
MFLDGARANFKDHANFAVSFALNHPREHFRLAFAQTKCFGTDTGSVVEFHNLFLQLCVIVICASPTCRIYWIAVCTSAYSAIRGFSAQSVRRLRFLGEVYCHA